MLCDWKAATLRHADGDLGRSIEQNAERFGYGGEMKRLLLNTAKRFDWL
jgi:predicted acetyltransferase